MRKGSVVLGEEHLRQQLALKSPHVNLEEGSGPAVAKILAEELSKKENAHVDTLTISNCALSVDGGKALKSLFETNVSLKSLTLSSTGVVGHGFLAIVAGLQMNKSITSLTFQLEPVSDQGGAALVEMVRKNESLRELEFAQLQLGQQAAHIIEALLEQRRITKLRMAFGAILDDAIMEQIWRTLQSNNKVLDTLDLSNNKIQEGSARALAECLRHDTVLKSVNIAQNLMTPISTGKILDALATNSTLSKLNLSRNNIDGASLKRLLLENSSLKSLNVTISLQDFPALISGLEHNSTLQELYVEAPDAKGTDEFCEELTKLLTVAKSLHALIPTYKLTLSKMTIQLVERQQMKSTGIFALAKAFQHNRNVRRFRWPYLTPAAEEECAGLLAKNGSLTDCDRYFKDICARNLKRHQMAKLEVLSLLMIRRRTTETSILHVLPKDVVKLIARWIWDARTQVN